MTSLVPTCRTLFSLFVTYTYLRGVDTFLIQGTHNEYSTNASWKRQKIACHLSQQTRATENEVLDRKLLSISLFSFLHQAAMPFAELVDSACLSKMDSTSLGAMGAAKSSQVRVEI
jgi:hypothetical protein